MASALVLLAEGFEEIEAITVTDVLRRADIDVMVAALTKTAVMGAHKICVQADCLLDELKLFASGDEAVGPASKTLRAFDAVILPGGMPGSKNLRDDVRVRQLLVEQMQGQRVVAAICAAPMALEAAGILGGRSATSYPGTELPSANYSEARVVVDGNLVTSRGPGTAIDFALALVEQLTDGARAARLRASMLVA